MWVASILFRTDMSPHRCSVQLVLLHSPHSCRVAIANLSLPCCAGTAAILAVAGSKPTVTADNQGRIGVERQMRINLTCDHRIVYGSQAAEFMQTLKAVLESPDQLVY